MTDDARPDYRDEPMSDEERRAHGQEWIARCRAVLAGAVSSAADHNNQP